MRHKYAEVILTASVMLGSLLIGFILGSIQEDIENNMEDPPKPPMGFKTRLSSNPALRKSDED